MIKIKENNGMINGMLEYEIGRYVTLGASMGRYWRVTVSWGLMHRTAS
jgi:hypothetical protein